MYTHVTEIKFIIIIIIAEVHTRHNQATPLDVQAQYRTVDNIIVLTKGKLNQYHQDIVVHMYGEMFAHATSLTGISNVL